MKLSGLVSLVEHCIKKMDAINIVPNANSGTYFNLMRRLLRRRWHQLLCQLSAKRFDQEGEITSQQVDIIKQFFSVNWSLQQSFDAAFTIKTNDAIFTIIPHELAKFLAEILHVTDDLPAHQLLMPTVDFTRIDTATNTPLASLPLSSLQLSDDNRMAIKVTNVSIDIDKESREIKTYLKEVGNDGKEVALRPCTEDEVYRLHHHSHASEVYYQALCKVSEERENQYSLFPDKTEQDFECEIRQIKTNFNNTLQSGVAVKAIYRDDPAGFRGLPRLKKILHANVDELFESRDELFDYMSRCLERTQQWETFIDSFTVDVLLKLMTDHENKDYADSAPHAKVERTIKEEKYVESEEYNNDECYAKAVHFCLTKLFWKTRAVRGEVTSLAGSLFASEEQRKPAKEKGVNHLLSPLDGKVRDKQAVTFEDIEKMPRDNAIHDGTLGILTNQMMKRFCKPILAANSAQQVKQNK